MRKFGLIGKNISYSFSRAYFKKKFESENIQDATYLNFDIHSIDAFKSIVQNNPDLVGLNITIPYKESIIPFLDSIDKNAQTIGAVNTLKFSSDGRLTGYNTDYYGFKKSLRPLLKVHHKKALILGTGGASKAIANVLKNLGIEHQYVSRTKTESGLTYDTLNADIIKTHTLIINCTPLGTHPNVDACPNIPYNALNEQHLLYDLIYNPEETSFLKQGKNQGAQTCNGLKMLIFQAEKAWEIWNQDE